MAKNPFKSTDKVAIIYKTKNGSVKRTRFFKGTSTYILRDQKELRNGEYITKEAWVSKFGPVDPKPKPVSAYQDIRFFNITEKELYEIAERGYNAKVSNHAKRRQKK